MRKGRLLLLIAAFLLALLGCTQGLPDQSGEYEIKAKSLTWDGREYEFLWAGKDGQLHRTRGHRIKLIQDTRTYLEIKGGDAVVHLAPEEPITVQAEDDRGGFTVFWFPFPTPFAFLTPSTVPTYHYPPADAFGRGDTVRGSITHNKPAAPDYSKVKPAPHAVEGQRGGTGPATAATGKGAAVGGQAGGTGAGGAATGKGAFKAGSDSFTSKREQGKISASGAASRPTGGSKVTSSGAFSGGRSSGAFRGGGGGGSSKSGARGGGGGKKR